VTIYLTAEQILFIHYRLLSELVASMAFGILGCWNRPLHGPDIFETAAALMESLNNHPFIDGNKRTGIVCTALFFTAEWYYLFGKEFRIGKVYTSCCIIKDQTI
jgi:hypothetical protein